MFKKKAIDEWALDYWLLQQYAKLCIRIFYRRIEVINKHNIPVNQPVILAPNHQNALMDAMILVCNTPLQNVFLARADIFKGRLLIRFRAQVARWGVQAQKIKRECGTNHNGDRIPLEDIIEDSWASRPGRYQSDNA